MEANKRWFVAFDIPRDYQWVLNALIEMEGFTEGSDMTCPDDKERITIEVSRATLMEIRSARRKGTYLSFYAMSRESPDWVLKFEPDFSRPLTPPPSTGPTLEELSVLERLERIKQKHRERTLGS